MICRRERRASRGLLPTAEELLNSLQSLMCIGAAEGNCSGPLNVIGGPGSFTDGFSQLFLFSTVNNFAGIEALPMELAIKFIDKHEPTRSSILNQFRSGALTIFSRAVAEKLLEAAIEACDAKTAHDLLALEIVTPDDIVCTESFIGYKHADEKSRRLRTAIEKASILRHFDTIDLLLRFGADVNKTYEDPGSQSERGALECAISLWGQYRPIDLKLVDLLLNNGATVSSRLVEAAVRWGDTGLIEKLLSSLPPSRHRDCFFQVLIDAAEYLRNDTGYKVIRQIMRACRGTHHNACVGSNPTLFAKAMVKAARRKNRELVDLLLPHGGQQGLDSALTAASRSGSHSLVHLLLAHGARGDGPACKVDTYDSFLTTPLAEAIRGDDAELVGLFEEVGAWDRIGEPDRLEAALQAIAESGNLVYLAKALSLVPNPKPKALTNPLNAAIKAGHEEVALKLLEAGADTNWLGAKSPLLEALRSRSQNITWAILEHDVRVKTDDSRYLLDETPLEAATAWGDPQIIKALFFMGANINTCRHEPPLSIAIRAGERSLIDLIISLGADFSVFSERCLSPLAAAALVGDAETANYLLDHGANPADEQAVLNAHTHERRILHLILQKFRKQHPKGRPGFGGRVLHHGLQTHDEALLDLCLNVGFDVNCLTSHKEYGSVTALGLAIKIHRGRCLGLISKLLSAGGDANVLASERREQLSSTGPSRGMKRVMVRQTAFLDAIETKSLPLVELLISNGADVRKEANLGLKRTPLQKACEVASHTIVDLLLAHNADVNADPAARGGATAIQLASKAGSMRIAKKMLAMGANVNAPGVRIGGRSAIEYAAEYGRLNMIPVLFNAAGGRFSGGQHESAIALAQENGHSACAVLLRSLASENQGLMDGSILPEDGGNADVLC